MRPLRPLLVLLALGCAAGPKAPPAPAVLAAPAPVPPVARREPGGQVIHGRTLADDYAWMRKKGTPEVEAYLRAENTYADAVLAPLEPLRERLYAEALSRLQQTDLSVPWPKGGYLYYSRNEEGKQYPIHCRRRGSPQAPEEVILDLNALAAGEKFLALGEMEPSDDGGLLAYTVDRTGFRVHTLEVKDLRTGQLLADRAERVDSVAWAANGRTLFYVTEDDAKRPYRLWRHALGTEASGDVLVYEEKDERFHLGVERSRSGELVVLHARSHTQGEARVLRASDPAGTFRTVIARTKDLEYDLDHRGTLLYLRINDRGRNFRLVAAPLDDPRPERWTELVPHRDDVMLEAAHLFRGHAVLRERRAGLPVLRVLDLEKGGAREVAFDEPVYSVFPDRNEDFAARAFRFTYESLVTPQSIYEVDLSTLERRLLKREPVLGGYDPFAYEQARLEATAPDGTRVPISLVRKKGLARDGSTPMVLAGYGSYGFPFPVTFDSSRVSLLDRGVAFAVAHIRGGGEMGKRWHDEGRMLRKRNTFGDFVACAEHLVRERWTSPDRLAIRGASAGGLLMGAAVNARPDLFKAAVALVPFVDVMNTMLDETLPLTVGEFEEWGNPKVEADFEAMLAYSPYDNVRAQAYPVMLVKSAYNDSQVMYWEPAKWVARLRATKTDRNPLLLRMDMDPAGHGGKSGRYEKLREQAFVNAFVLWQLGVTK